MIYKHASFSYNFYKARDVNIANTNHSTLWRLYP